MPVGGLGLDDDDASMAFFLINKALSLSVTIVDMALAALRVFLWDDLLNSFGEGVKVVSTNEGGVSGKSKRMCRAPFEEHTCLKR